MGFATGSLLLVTVVSLRLVASPVAGDSPVPRDCKDTSLDRHYILMCHTPSPETRSYSCAKDYPWQGFVVEHLFAGPKPPNKDCELAVSDLLNVTCVRESLKLKDKYDEVIFDILGAVSGQHEVQQTNVPRLPSLATVGTGAGMSPESAFIVFKQTCKSAKPHSSTEDFKVINICSNTTISGLPAYLTFKGTEIDSLPREPSLCRCSIKPTSAVVLNALDIRLQNHTNRQCGPTEFEMKSGDNSADIKCSGMSSLYGSKEIFRNQGEIIVTLTHVSAYSFPTAIWIEVGKVEDYSSSGTVTVTCEGFVPMPEPTTPPVDGSSGEKDDDDDDGDDDVDGESANVDGAGTSKMTLIIGAVVGSVLLIVLLLFVCIRRRRGGKSLLPGACSGPCCRRDGSGKHHQVPQLDPVYSEPHNPRPANLAFNFPASPEEDGNVYAEPENGTSRRAPPGPATTPPPLPDSPPPSSPPPDATFKPDTLGPPKPARTFTADPPADDYDHIETGTKSRLKSVVSPRDKQNNIIDGDAERDNASSGNVYSHLNHGGSYSQTGSVQKKKEVKDKEYNRTA